MNMSKNIRDLFEEFMKQSEFSTRLSKETLRNYRTVFDTFTAVMPDVTLEALNEGYMAEFFRRLEKRERKVGRGWTKKGVKKSTVLTYHWRLGRFFTWLHQRGHIKSHPLADVKKPDVRYIDIKWLKKEDVQKIFTALAFGIKWPHNFMKKRNVAIFSVLLYCGLRKNELLNLKILDIDLDRRILRVNGATSKSQNDRVVPLNQSVIDALRDYMDHMKDLPEVRPVYLWFSAQEGENRLTAFGLKHLMKRVADASGVKFHPHMFRHTFAVNQLAQGVDIAALQQLLGHRDIRMTSVYLRCLPATLLRSAAEGLTLETLQ